MNCQNCSHPLTSTHGFCVNCGRAVSEPNKSKTATDSYGEQSIIKIRIKKPIMIGQYQLNSVFTGLVAIFAATLLITSIIINGLNGINISLAIFLLIMGLSSFLGSDISTLKKRCPHCKKKIEYKVAHDVVYDCPYCLGKIIVNWQ